jgi:hypothetical protein
MDEKLEAFLAAIQRSVSINLIMILPKIEKLYEKLFQTPVPLV